MTDRPAPPDRPPWWRIFRHASLKDTQASLWSAAMHSEQTLGRDNPHAKELRADYRAHVRQYGYYDIPHWRTR